MAGHEPQRRDASGAHDLKVADLPPAPLFGDKSHAGIAGVTLYESRSLVAVFWELKVAHGRKVAVSPSFFFITLEPRVE